MAFFDPISWEYSWPYYLGALVFGYLLGSIPFGLIFTRIAGLGDIRSIGSGNIGATNVLRTGNRYIAAATLLFDGGKGAAAVLLAAAYGGPQLGAIAGVASFFGHIFPVWLGFKGGKGVATFLGLTIALYWPVGLLCCATWLVVAFVLRYSSLSALVAAAVSPIYMWFFEQPLFITLSFILAALIFWSHRENIQRLLAGTEPKIGASKSNTA